MTRQQLYLAARREVETRRQRAYADAELRRLAIWDKIPQLAQLDEQQATAGARAARFAANGRGDEAAACLQQLDDIAQRQQLLLAQHGYTSSDIEPHFMCPLCQDTGQKDGAMCTCLLNEVKRMRRNAINMEGPLFLSRFESFSLDRYPLALPDCPQPPRQSMEIVLNVCKNYALHFGPHSENLLLYGNAGLGKTHLALAVASQVLDKGYDVIYVSAQSAFSQISAARYDAGNELFNGMMDADLLVLDDLGTEHLDSYVLSRMYELINGRLHRRPTIYTTNILSQEMFNHRYTEKIASRLLGECTRLKFVGQDLRLHK